MKLTETDINIIINFINEGGRLNSYRKFNKEKASDLAIYRWFKRKEVNDFILEIGSELSVYDIVCDKKLLSIINDPKSSNKDILNAIKMWNELRKRTFIQVQLESTKHLDLSNVTDDVLENLVSKLIEKRNE